MPAATVGRGRRSQEERSASTQRLLLDAAVDCLVEHGYGALTTTMVAERAGVSRGAQLHHYRSRAALVAAAVEHVFAGLTDDYRAAFAALDRAQRTPAAAVSLLWSMYGQRRHQAILDLYAAARTDEELRAVLLPVAAAHAQNVRTLAAEYFPHAASDARFHVTLELLLQAMLGMALARCLYGDEGMSPELVPALEAMATQAVADAAAAPAGMPPRPLRETPLPARPRSRSPKKEKPS
ncbi:MAG TPA: TetR/AcrR family transcriptional regulator [Candidatus Limnocylindrales bacterium]|nr:TetR/AcrR family transcriptional regulator [Candidatus Limnocylindrales bacterium]